MEYTVQALAALAGVTPRTLRYYDKIGLLPPLRLTEAGYRIYGPDQVDALQHILLYRALEVPLADIVGLMAAPDFAAAPALRAHRARLLERRARLETLIATVDKTIDMTEGRIHMTDREKFEGLKDKMIAENEEKYGAEVREKYGDEQAEASNAQFKNLSPEQFEAMQALSQEIADTLAEAVKTGDPAGPLGQKAAGLHRQWLGFFWPTYNKDAHAGLAQMYVDDERFTAYYDKETPGTAVFLRDAIVHYVAAQD